MATAKFHRSFGFIALVGVTAGLCQPRISWATDVDIVFIIDGSGSTTSSGTSGDCKFKFQKKVLENLICAGAGNPTSCSTCPYSPANCTCTCAGAQPLPVDGSVQVAVVQFSNIANTEVPLQVLNSSTAPQIFCSINCIGPIGQTTVIASGLQRAKSILLGSSRPTAERLVVLMSDELTLSTNCPGGSSSTDACLAAEEVRTLSNPARITTMRIGDNMGVLGGDPICTTPCGAEVLGVLSNNYYNFDSSPAGQPRGAFRCAHVCAGDPDGDQSDIDTFIEIVRGSICALNLSLLPTLPSIVQSPEPASVGQDVTLSISVQTTAGLTQVIDYQWQQETSPGVFQSIPGACANPYILYGVRPPPCGVSTSYKCVVSTPCDQKISSAKSFVFAMGPGWDCNNNAVPDVCDWVPTYQWTGTVGGTGTDLVGGDFTFQSNRRDDASGTAAAPTGEVVFAGSFSGTNINLNPLGTPQQLHTSSGTYDGFVVKLKRDGQPSDIAWSRSFGGAGDLDKSYAVAVDQQDGSVYVAGTFRAGTGELVDFNRTTTGCLNSTCTCDGSPCPECYGTTNAINTDTFINKYAADGTYCWTKVFAGQNSGGNFTTCKPLAITVADNHDIILAGWYTGLGTIDFNPSSGTDVWGAATSQGKNAFVTRLGADGSYKWTHVVASYTASNRAAATGVGADSAGTIYVCGWFKSFTDSRTNFDPPTNPNRWLLSDSPCQGAPNLPNCRIPLTGSGFGTDIFLMKLSTSGAFVSAQNLGSTTGVNEAKNLALDGFGNVLVCGNFQGTMSFDPANPSTNPPCGTAQPYCHVAVGNDDVFVAKFNGVTGAHLWSRTFGSTDFDTAVSVACDPGGNAILTGYFCRGSSGTCQVDFDPASATSDPHTTGGGSDVFVTQINSDGSYGWTYTFGSTSPDEGRGIAVTPGCASNVWLTGVFQGTVDFDPSPSVINNKTSNGFTDIFVSKFGAPAMAYSDCNNGNGAEDHCELGACVKGDVNYDGVVNGRDIQRFVTLLTGTARCPVAICPADMDNNQRLDFSDLQCFVTVLLGGGGCGSLCSGGSLLLSEDCNQNGINDVNDVADGTSQDCNHNFIPDECDLNASDPDGDGKVSNDVNGNGIPDECEPDCDHNGLPDSYEIAHGLKTDVNGNGVPDICEKDCNHNGLPDSWDISQHTSADCNLNGTPDECEQDCNGNHVPDDCDLVSGYSQDCNHNGFPDECDLTIWPPIGSLDCNANGIPDECDIASGHSQDANGNHIPDECEGGQIAAPGGHGHGPVAGKPGGVVSDDAGTATNTGETPVPQTDTGGTPGPQIQMMQQQDLDTAWEAFFEWSGAQCWGPGCPLAVEEQFRAYVDKLTELGLPVAGPH